VIAIGCLLQRGLHQPGFTHLMLSNEERRVINMHRNLERYLDLPEPERMSGGAPDQTLPT
jgi:choline monooxygenase